MQLQQKQHHNTTHGMKGTRLYGIWAGMKSRCVCPTNPDYAAYGARGVSVCREWQDFVPFMRWALANGYRDDLSIDRRNGKLGYSPGNCRWANHYQQNNNLKTNRWLTYRGRTLTVAQWAHELGITRYCMYQRLRRGVPESELFTGKSYQLVTYKGRSLNLYEWSRLLGTDRSTLVRRLKAGMTVEQTFETPLKRKHGRVLVRPIEEHEKEVIDVSSKPAAEGG